MSCEPITPIEGSNVLADLAAHGGRAFSQKGNRARDHGRNASTNFLCKWR